MKVVIFIYFLRRHKTYARTGDNTYAARGRSDNSLLLPNVPLQGMSAFGSERFALNELDSNELAFLQHQTQVQQLQLLQQMQSDSARMDWPGFDQNFRGHDARLYNNMHSLMPSADIMPSDIYPFESVLPPIHAAAQAIGHGRKVSSTKAASHAKGPIELSSNFVDGDPYNGRHLEEDFVAHQRSLILPGPPSVSLALSAAPWG